MMDVLELICRVRFLSTLPWGSLCSIVVTKTAELGVSRWRFMFVLLPASSMLTDTTISVFGGLSDPEEKEPPGSVGGAFCV